jgi:threonine synthase
MGYRAWFECFEDCDETHALTEVVTRCRNGGLLDVRHDMDALADRSGAEWRDLFDSRLASAPWPERSGVWSRREWVLPEIATENIISTGEGNTPLLPATRLGEALGVGDLRIKMCGNTHTGSFKDLGMTVLVSAVAEMRSRGTEVAAIACASTGDTSAALSAYCALAGIPAVVFLPRGKISTAQLVQPLANHALVLSLDTDFDGCMKVVQEVTADGSIYLANSMNPLRIEGQKTAAIEIAQQWGWEVPDFVVIPGGNLGNIYAFGRGFQMMKALGLVDRVPRLVCVQAALANPLYEASLTDFQVLRAQVAGPTEASAIRIGDPVSMPRAVRILREMDGLVEQATEDELANAAGLADAHGLYLCPHTAVALAGLRRLIADGTIDRSHRVAVVSTAHGLKFTEHKVRYHEGALPDVTSRHAHSPVELPADPSRVREAIRKAIGA